MTEIYLIRHGQASFGSDDYDRLSELGLRQCQVLQQHLREQQVRFDAIYSGPHLRQRQTARHATDSADAAVREGFAEYDAGGLFEHYLPAVLAADPALQGEQAQLRRDRRTFQLTLEKVLAAWCADAAPPAGLESWHSFRDRIATELQQIITSHRGQQRVAVLSSAGAIGAAVAHGLGLALPAGLKLSYALYNTSVCRLRYGRLGWVLTLFNGLAHLERAEHAELVTYR
jgi:broad specificity phosphatase PhoE